MRIEPPPSEPVASGTTPPAIAAELPPDDPPGVRSRFHGLRVGPNSTFLVNGGVAEFGRVGFADDDGAGRLEPRDLHRIFLRRSDS